MDEEKIVYRIDELPNPDDKKKIIECLKLDHRYVGDKEKEDYGPLFSEFIKTDGMFYQFNMFVKGKTYGKYHEGDLVVALRGNGNCITIYHNNHVVWELSLKTARNGKWQQGPGMDLFGAVREQFGDLPIIAEDLGFEGLPEVEKNPSKENLNAYTAKIYKAAADLWKKLEEDLWMKHGRGF